MSRIKIDQKYQKELLHELFNKAMTTALKVLWNKTDEKDKDST